MVITPPVYIVLIQVKPVILDPDSLYAYNQTMEVAGKIH
jgi:hypothetical protein